MGNEKNLVRSFAMPIDAEQWEYLQAKLMTLGVIVNTKTNYMGGITCITGKKEAFANYTVVELHHGHPKVEVIKEEYDEVWFLTACGVTVARDLPSGDINPVHEYPELAFMCSITPQTHGELNTVIADLTPVQFAIYRRAKLALPELIQIAELCHDYLKINNPNGLHYGFVKSTLNKIAHEK